jgi:hypothetical protein
MPKRRGRRASAQSAARVALGQALSLALSTGVHKLWGRPPGLRGSPWTRSASADEGVGSGPGGPPHNQCRCSVVGKLSGIEPSACGCLPMGFRRCVNSAAARTATAPSGNPS